MVSATKSLLVNLAFVALATAGPAPVNTDSSKKAVARAHLDQGLVKGIIEFTTKDEIVNVHLDTTGLPPNAGPFFYHINAGKCGSSNEILNPYESVYGVCDELANDSECAVGDLSGKHGYINTTCFETQYQDPYLSLNKGNKAFVAGNSVVIIDQNKNQISCGNINMARKAKLSRDEFHAYSESLSDTQNEGSEALEELKFSETAPESSLEASPIALEEDSFVTHLPTNGTFGNSSWEETDYDSGSNVLLASGLVGALAGGLALLI